MKSSEIAIPVGDSKINGNLTLVPNSKGLVVFAHGSGSSRFSKRNQYVADVLNKSKISTFLFDLLTEKEDEVDQYTAEFRFNIPLLAERLILVTSWLKDNKNTTHFKLGYFGSSTGSAAALIAAAKLPEHISAVVSRGGRPDLAFEFLPKVKAPTLLIVGGWDDEVIQLNETAFAHLKCVKEISIIPNATHLFEETGTLEQVAKVAADWFVKYLR
ncbi:dienelactone hydrolase family protein [Candidatus Dependentiae bacterium]|nr:dienelactone hydrolase family protein [Candidatus Dependentiae bacterium]